MPCLCGEQTSIFWLLRVMARGAANLGFFLWMNRESRNCFERFDVLADAVEVAGLLAIERTAYHAYEGGGT